MTLRVRSRLEVTLTLIGEAARVYPRFLRGAESGSGFFRRSDILLLWRRYFRNDNLAYGAMNELAAFAVGERVLAPRLRVLELGGGLGSAAEALLGRCEARIESYLFTDQLPPFLQWGRRHLEERFPDSPIEFQRLDFDRPFAHQGVPPRTVDLCYAVNALHAARDLLGTLREVRSVLAVGGTLVVAEALRPRRGTPVPIEFVFQLSEDFRSFREEPDFRTSGGFLHHRDWIVALERAGFSNVRTVPDIGAAVRAYPAHAMGVILADR